MKLSSAQKNLIKLFYTLNKTPLSESGCLSNLYYLLAAQASSFLIHLLFRRNHLARTWEFPPHCAGLVWLTRHHASQLVTKGFLPTLLHREAEDFPRGGKYFNHVPRLTFTSHQKILLGRFYICFRVCY